MSKIITKKELWNLPNEQIAALTKGKFVKIVMNDGEEQIVFVKNLLAAANPPHLFTGFLTSDDHDILLSNIDYVELINDKL